eukprot:scaffold18214_cov33-Attheya_sp.AAC.3
MGGAWMTVGIMCLIDLAGGRTQGRNGKLHVCFLWNVGLFCTADIAGIATGAPAVGGGTSSECDSNNLTAAKGLVASVDIFSINASFATSKGVDTVVDAGSTNDSSAVTDVKYFVAIEDTAAAAAVIGGVTSSKSDTKLPAAAECLVASVDIFSIEASFATSKGVDTVVMLVLQTMAVLSLTSKTLLHVLSLDILSRPHSTVTRYCTLYNKYLEVQIVVLLQSTRRVQPHSSSCLPRSPPHRPISGGIVTGLFCTVAYCTENGKQITHIDTCEDLLQGCLNLVDDSIPTQIFYP